MKLVRLMFDQAGSGNSKMVVSRLQIHLYQLKDKVSTKFQSLDTHVIGFQLFIDSGKDCATKSELEKLSCYYVYEHNICVIGAVSGRCV